MNLSDISFKEIKEENLETIVSTYKEHGAVFFPGFFEDSSLLENYKKDLKALVIEQFAWNDHHEDSDKSLDDLIVKMLEIQPTIGKTLCGLGTQPNMFVSGNLLKYSPAVVKLVEKIYDNDSVVATPAAGDTLHIFPPGKNFYKYNLPIHQDYPYLMQSPDQTTVIINLSQKNIGNGGVRVWLKSHKLGVVDCLRNENNHFEIADSSILEDLDYIDFEMGSGDLLFMNSLCSHQSIKNKLEDKCRILQLFRFSNLNNETSKSYSWKSRYYDRPSVKFEDIHADIFKDVNVVQ